MSTYFTLLTDVGASAMAYAAAHASPVVLTQVALGDGGGSVPTPVKSQTALVNEVYRANISSITQDPANPSWYIVQLDLPADIGGFTIREFRIDDASGNAIYIGNCAPEVKPVLPDGMTRQSIYRLIVETSNSANIQLVLDPNILTDAYVTEKIASAINTLDYKQSVRVASTANIAALSGLLTIDGVALNSGDRVLVKNQTTGSANGIYTAAAGAWTRSADANISAFVTASMIVPVEEGTLNADTLWSLVTNNQIILGTTSLVFDWVGGRRVTRPLGTSDITDASTEFVQKTLGGLLSKSVAGGANVTLTADEAGNGILRFTGALTANIAVILPASPTRPWVVHNNTSGNYTLTVKLATGTGVAVSQGYNDIVWTDGANVYDALSERITQNFADNRYALKRAGIYPEKTLINATGNFTVPAGVKTIRAYAIGPGANGTAGTADGAAGNGGSGGGCAWGDISVNPGDVIACTIDATQAVFGSYLTATAGSGRTTPGTGTKSGAVANGGTASGGNGGSGWTASGSGGGGGGASGSPLGTGGNGSSTTTTGNTNGGGGCGGGWGGNAVTASTGTYGAGTGGNASSTPSSGGPSGAGGPMVNNYAPGRNQFTAYTDPLLAPCNSAMQHHQYIFADGTGGYGGSKETTPGYGGGAGPQSALPYVSGIGSKNGRSIFGGGAGGGLHDAARPGGNAGYGGGGGGGSSAAASGGAAGTGGPGCIVVFW